MATRRASPYLNYNFTVEIQGLLRGGFTEVSGLDADTETETVEEGGLNTGAHILPGKTTFSDLVMRRGVTDSDVLWPWYQKVIQGKVERRNVTISMLDGMGNAVTSWNFERAFPKRFAAPSFDSMNAQIAFQEIVLAHEGMSKGQ